MDADASSRGFEGFGGLVLAIFGPTASGKSAVAEALATEDDGFRRAAEGRVRPRFVDEHATVLDVPLRDAWGAARAWVDRLLVRGEGSRLALLLGAEPRAGRQLAERQPVAGHEDVARVLARGYGRDDEPVGRGGGQVLVGVHRKVDLPAKQPLAQRTDEHAGTAESLDSAGRGVPQRGDLDELDALTANGRQGVRDRPGLRKGEGGTPGAEAQGGGLHGHEASGYRSKRLRSASA